MNNQYQTILSTWHTIPLSSPEDIDLQLDSFRILFAYHSGVIENAEITYHHTREVFENGKINAFSGDVRTLFEIQNQKACYEFLRGKIAAREPITEELVLKVHELLTAGTYDEVRYKKGERPGTYKKHDYVTGRLEVGSAPEDVAGDVQELLQEVTTFQSASDRDTLSAAAFLHCNLENIHPFSDGNGRIGRTLMNYFLMINNHPPVIVYEEDRPAYYAALEVFDRDLDLKPMTAFLEAETVKTWERRFIREKRSESTLKRFNERDDSYSR